MFRRKCNITAFMFCKGSEFWGVAKSLRVFNVNTNTPTLGLS